MEKLIERYIYDVARRLPEKDREEVRRELIGNIYDMLPEQADEEQVKAVLYELGSPASLAVKYRQNPGYLISPNVYDEYLRTLKWVVPLVGVIVLAAGMLLGLFNSIKDGMVELGEVIGNVISSAISMGISGIIHAVAWTTVGFVIADRTGYNKNSGVGKEWKVEDLPAVTPYEKGRIPLSDSIVELVATVVFSGILIFLCSGFSVSFSLRIGNGQIEHLFHESFLAACIPAVAIGAVFGVAECIVKIKDRCYTPLVCWTTVVSTLVGMGVFTYLLHRRDIFSDELFQFAREQGWSIFENAQSGGNGAVIGGLTVVIVVGSLTYCCWIIFKTYFRRKKHQ